MMRTSNSTFVTFVLFSITSGVSVFCKSSHSVSIYILQCPKFFGNGVVNVKSDETPVCFPSSGGFQCRCENQYHWSCDQCFLYGPGDNITSGTCGCINAIPPDRQYCKSADQHTGSVWRGGAVGSGARHTRRTCCSSAISRLLMLRSHSFLCQTIPQSSRVHPCLSSSSLSLVHSFVSVY